MRSIDGINCEELNSVEDVLETLFKIVGLPMVENCLSGYNSCVFAYGQTGSAKAYTMLREIEELEFRPSPHHGMTPCIFEFLFARIRLKEESRREERLKHSRKCSFLEIYNEQITDRLDPSSTNLMLCEDITKGVYVENLSEFEVQIVGDILKLLSQGSSNRRVAATNMNRESSGCASDITVWWDIHVLRRQEKSQWEASGSIRSLSHVLLDFISLTCCLHLRRFTALCNWFRNSRVHYIPTLLLVVVSLQFGLLSDWLVEPEL